MLIRCIRAELGRELALRQQVFPRLIRDGRMSQGEADLRMERLTAAIELLDLLTDHGVHQTTDLPFRLTPPPGLHNMSDILSDVNIIKDGAK